MSLITANEYQSRWEVWICDQHGARIELADNAVSFRGVRTANNKGSFILTLPGNFDTNLLNLDGMVEFWRAPFAGAMSWVLVGFMRQFRYAEAYDGSDLIIVSGPDVIDLLDRRIVAYAAGTSQASKTDYADDMLVEIVDENLESSATDSDRDLSGYNFSIVAGSSAAPSVSKAFSWQKVLPLLQNICQMSKTDGTDLYFDIVPYLVSNTEIGFRFTTFIDQIGQDLTYDAGGNIVFGREWGNLERPIYTEDYTQEVNVVYAGGQGEGADRNVNEEEDTTRSGASIWNRREAFRDARNLSTDAAVTDSGNARLAEGKPKITFTGTLLDSAQTRYGLDWKFGDKVTATYLGKQFDGMVKSVEFGVSENKQETIKARLEVEL